MTTVTVSEWGGSIIFQRPGNPRSTRQMMEEYYDMPYAQIPRERIVENPGDEGEPGWGEDVGGEVIRG